MGSIPQEDSLLENLTKDLVGQVKNLVQYLNSAGTACPSFEMGTSATVLPEGAPQSAHVAREHVMDCALQIFQLAAGPSEYLANLQTGYHYIACLQWLCQFNIFSHVPLDKSISYSDLATLANVSEPHLKSIARMAMTNRLFVETSPQQISHSATSALLRTNQNFHDWAVFMCDISAPTAAAMTVAHQKWPKDSEKTHTAYNAAFDTDIPFFQHLGQLPERHKQFAGYMKSVTTSQGTHMKHLVNGYDWASLGKAVVVDVGGSTGHGAVALAQEYPDLTFIVQDLPEVVRGWEENIAALHDAKVSERLTFQPHNFFEGQQVSGADVYLLRMILHDWASDDAVKILANIVSAMTRGSKLIIMDTVLPTPNSLPAAKERLLRVRDLTMMQVFNSLERATEDWDAIFVKADPRLTVKCVVQPFGSVMSLMEVVLVEG